jgi:hypothetical protein
MRRPGAHHYQGSKATYASTLRVACACHNVVVALLLLPVQIETKHKASDPLERASVNANNKHAMCSRDELGHVLRVVAEVRIHQEYKRTSADLQAINVCTAQSHLAWPRMNHHFAFTKDALQLLCNFNGAIRRIILNNHHFIVQFATHTGEKAGSTIEK